MFEDGDGALLDNIVGHSFVVADTREGVVTIAVMDLATLESRAVFWVGGSGGGAYDGVQEQRGHC